MSKVEINLVADAMKQAGVDPSKLREVIEMLNEESQADEGEKIPAVKKQFAFILSDPAGTIKGRIDVNNLVGWVVQIPEDESPHSTCERIFKGAYDFNASKKGRLLPVKSVGEALESVSAKYFKEAELWVKTRMPIGVIVTDNVLPRDEFKVEKVDRRSKQGEIEGLSHKITTRQGSVTVDARGVTVETNKARAEVEAIFKKHGVKYEKDVSI